MSVLTLKIIAVISMLLDHIGYATGSYVLRCIGRLAFPIYAFLIGNGFRHTANPGRYLGRLLLLAALSQIPYTLFLYDTMMPERLNVFVTLSLGLVLVWALDRCDHPTKKLLCLLAAVGLCLGIEHFVPMDYGLRGVLLIAAFYLCAGNPSMIIAFIVLYYLPIWESLLTGGTLPANWPQSLFGALALPLLYCYNNQPGYHHKALQWAFYLFYPVHLLVLHLLIH